MLSYSTTNICRPNLCGKWNVLRQLLHSWRENEADKNKVLIFSKSAKLLTFLELEIAKSEGNLAYMFLH